MRIEPSHPDPSRNTAYARKVVDDPLQSTFPERTLKPGWHVVHVSDIRSFERCCRVLQKASIISVDTETYGEKGEPLNARLSLIQIGLPDPYDSSKGKTYLIDLKSLASAQAKSGVMKAEQVLEKLRPILESPQVLKIIQVQAFEKDQFRRYKIDLQNVYDTEKEARRLAPRLVSYTLAALAREFLGKIVNKDEQTSQWGLRPLSPSQIEYAALDPEITFKVAERLMLLSEQAKPAAISDHKGALRNIETLHRQYIEIMRPFAESYYLLEASKEKRKAAIKTLVLEAIDDGSEKFEFRSEQLGSVQLVLPRVFEPDLNKLRTALPGQCESIIEQSVAKKDLETALKSAGYERKAIDSYLKQLSTQNPPSISLAIELNYEQLYTRADNLSVGKARWKRIKTEGDLKAAEKFKVALADSLALSVVLEKPVQKGEEIRILVGVPAKNGKTGAVFELAGADKEQVQALSQILIKGEHKLIAYSDVDLKKHFPTASSFLAGLTVLESEATLFRPDLLIYNPEVLCSVFLGEKPLKSSAYLAEKAFEINKKFEQYQLLIEPSVNLEATLEEKLSAQLKGIIEDSSRQLTLLRPLNCLDQVVHKKLENTLSALTEHLDKASESSQKIERFECESGSAAILKRRENTVIDPDKVHKALPQIAPFVIKEVVTKAALEEILLELPPALREKIMEDVFVGISYKAPQIRIYPAFSSLYQA